MAFGASLVIALCLGYAVWALLMLVPKRKAKPVAPIALDVTFYPFALTQDKVERYKRVLFYGGLVTGLVVYGFTLNPVHLFFIFSSGFLGGLVLDKGVEWSVKHKKRQMVAELSIYLDTFLSLHKSGLNMEDALRDSLAVTKHLPALMNSVLKKWHDRGGAERAIKSLETSDLAEIKTLATMLIQVIRGGEKSLDFVEQWKDQLAMMEHLNRQASANTKPVVYTVLLGLPFLASVITWFYPYFVQARDMFSGFLGM